MTQPHDIVQHIAEPHLATRAVFLYYMLGAAARGAYRLIHWWGAAQRKTILRTALASSVKEVILAAMLAFIWTQGLLWVAIDLLGWEVPEFSVTALSSLAVGFFMTWLLGERIIEWVERKSRSSQS